MTTKLIPSLKTPSLFSSIKKIFSLLTYQERWKWVKLVGFAVCISALEVITASVVVVLAQVLNAPESGKIYFMKLGLGENISPGRTILYITVFCGVIYLIKNSIAAAEVFYQSFYTQKIHYHFKNKVLRRFADIDYGKYLMRNSSYGMAVIGDVHWAFSVGLLSLVTIITEIFVSSFLIAMIIYINPSLALFIFAIAGITALILTKVLFPLFYRWGQKLQESSLLAGQNLMQFFHGFKEIILLGKRDSFIAAYKIHSYRLSQIQARQAAVNHLPRLIIEVLFILLFVSLIAYLCYEKDTPQELIGIMGGYLYVGFRLTPGMNRIISQLTIFKSAIPYVDRLHKEFTSEIEHIHYMDKPELKFEKDISFKSVSFRYINTKKDALKNVNLCISKGECIGIVGETGSGKSTLVDLILGLLYQKSGEILIDGKYPVCSYQWHQKVGYVPQSIYLTDDTIEANIAFGEDLELIDRERLNKSMNDAQLSSFINQLPEGLSTFVGERGIRLSGGERQRIAIARALYRNPEVLIFDEATSALDNETEARLMETIHAVSKDRTVIMIAHRLTTLKDCDRIITMENGTISKIMSYDHLRAKG